MTSQLNVDTIQNKNGGSVTLTDLFPPKAHVTYDGVTPQIIGSANVSSATDNGQGNHTMNLINNLPNTNYSLVTGLDGHRLATGSQQFALVFSTDEFTTSFRLLTRLCDNDAATFATSDLNRISATAVP